MCEKVVEGVETLSESEELIARSVDGTSAEPKGDTKPRPIGSGTNGPEPKK